jgi:hypothetical protein
MWQGRSVTAGQTSNLSDGFIPSQQYDEARAHADEIMQAARVQLAAVLSRALSVEVASAPQETYDEKRKLASWVRNECRRYGVSLACQRSGRPSFMEVRQNQNGNTPSYFLFHSEDDEGHVQHKTHLKHIVSLSVLPVPPPPSRWINVAASRVRQDGQRSRE